MYIRINTNFREIPGIYEILDLLSSSSAYVAYLEGGIISDSIMLHLYQHLELPRY